MINYCNVDPEKLRNFKFKIKSVDDDEEELDRYIVGVFDQHGDYLIYEFEDPFSYLNFLDMLDDDGVEYDILDDEDVEYYDD